MHAERDIPVSAARQRHVTNRGRTQNTTIRRPTFHARLHRQNGSGWAGVHKANSRERIQNVTTISRSRKSATTILPTGGRRGLTDIFDQVVIQSVASISSSQHTPFIDTKHKQRGENRQRTTCILYWQRTHINLGEDGVRGAPSLRELLRAPDRRETHRTKTATWDI